MIAGYVDAYGFISYRTYVSFMSGNTTQTGSLIGQGSVAAALPALLAIAFFFIGVFTGTFLAHSGARQSRWLPFGLVATLLALSIGVGQLGSFAGGAGIATLSLAMGFMNTALSRVGAQSVNLVFVTGTLNAIAQHLALAVKRAPLAEAQGSWDTHRRRAFLLAGVWVSFLTGAVLAGVATSRFGVWLLLLPVLILLALAAFPSFTVSSPSRR
jgi:uncharacterized membrane protein YoaK (UPF0700 family)